MKQTCCALDDLKFTAFGVNFQQPRAGTTARKKLIERDLRNQRASVLVTVLCRTKIKLLVECNIRCSQKFIIRTDGEVKNLHGIKISQILHRQLRIFADRLKANNAHIWTSFFQEKGNCADIHTDINEKVAVVEDIIINLQLTKTIISGVFNGFRDPRIICENTKPMIADMDFFNILHRKYPAIQITLGGRRENQHMLPLYRCRPGR